MSRDPIRDPREPDCDAVPRLAGESLDGVAAAGGVPRLDPDVYWLAMPGGFHGFVGIDAPTFREDGETTGGTMLAALSLSSGMALARSLVKGALGHRFQG